VSDHEQVEILLVEDNPLDAEMTMRAFSERHFLNHMHWVKDGAEAIEFIRCTGKYATRDPGELPRLMLLDLKMPKMGGLDVLRELKSDRATRNLPVVVMTSSMQERDVIESYELGVNGYVVKPIDFRGLADVVERIGLYWLMVNKVPEPGRS
jgi:two-component system response regulator